MRAAVVALCILVVILAACLYETDQRSKRTARRLNEFAARLPPLDAYTRNARARLDALEHTPALPALAALFTGDAYTDTSDRAPEHCGRGARTAVLLIAGQSNGANMGGGGLPRIAGPRVINYNVLENHCYRAQDPLLGTSGGGNNFATLLGDMLVDRGRFDSVILAPIAAASTRIEQWIPGAQYHARFLAALAIQPTHILWQQGEANNDGESYALHLRAIVTSLRNHWAAAPFYVALGTKCSSGPHEAVRQALRKATTWPGLDVRLGPDTDALGADFRSDTCHFNARGIEAQAAMWADTISKKIVSSAP